MRLKRDGKVYYSEAKTFDRKQAASAWLEKRERELAKEGAVEEAQRPVATLTAVIDRYTSESLKQIGRTKAQVLGSIKGYDIASEDCREITGADIVALASELSEGRTPQTVGNYLSHLASIFAIARPEWGYALDERALADAQKVLKRLGSTAKSTKRIRRPALAELDLIMQHFVEQSRRAPKSMPMHQVIGFALFSTRR